MSYPPPNPTYSQPGYEPNNTLAIVGLVLGVCNFVICPALAPIGFGCSIMSMRNPAQRGISIAGLVLNCIGLLGFLAVVLYFVFIFAVIGVAAGAAVTMAPFVQTEVAMNEARLVMVREDPLPTEADGQLLIENDDIKDGWGTLLKYEPDGEEFIIRSAGPDREFYTDDDLTNDGTRTVDAGEFEGMGDEFDDFDEEFDGVEEFSVEPAAASR